MTSSFSVRSLSLSAVSLFRPDWSTIVSSQESHCFAFAALIDLHELGCLSCQLDQTCIDQIQTRVV